MACHCQAPPAPAKFRRRRSFVSCVRPLRSASIVGGTDQRLKPGDGRDIFLLQSRRFNVTSSYSNYSKLHE
jgi:hypothetical protein